MYKILDSQQGPVIVTDDGVVVFMYQYANLVELYYEDPTILDKLKEFVANKIKEYAEIEAKGILNPTTPGQGLLQNYLNIGHNLREFEYNALPSFKEKDGKD